MNATSKTLAFALLAALLTVAPAAAEDGEASPEAAQAAGGPCEAFYYSLNPPGAKVDPSCIGLLLDNSP